MREKKVKEQTANLLVLVKYTCLQFKAEETTVLMISTQISD